MENTNPQNNNVVEKPVVATAPVAPKGASTFPPAKSGARAPFDKNARPARGGRSGGRGGSGGFRGERTKPEFDQKIIDIRRVARVIAGGKRFSFSVTLVAGNKNGSVGVGMGKASDTAQAIDKAMRDAKKNMITLNLTKSMSIPHEVQVKFCSAIVLIMPAKGKGLVAGSSVRNVLELGGVKDVSAKLLSGTKNRINNAKAAIEALKTFAVKKGTKKPVAVSTVK